MMTDTARLAAALASRCAIERGLGAGGMATVSLPTTSAALARKLLDEEIDVHAAHPPGRGPAKAVCEALLQDALDGGGSDTVTIIVGRAVRKDR